MKGKFVLDTKNMTKVEYTTQSEYGAMLCWPQNNIITQEYSARLTS